MEQAIIIYNPRARNAPRQERLRAAAAAMEARGWQLDVRITQSAGHATELAREAAASGAGTVIACGGDGTLNEVVNGLAGSETRLALVRGGTGNVFAKEIGVPRAPEEALRVLLDPDVRRFDLGMAGDRYFLLMCGIGIDAAVVRRVPSKLKKLLGTTSHLVVAAQVLPGYRSRKVRLRIDEGEEREKDLYWLLMGNTRSYGGVIDITGRAIADDGLLDVHLFAGNKPRVFAASAARLLLKRHHGAPGVSSFRARSIDLLTPGLPVQADGEAIGETPMRFCVQPKAISILLPKGKGGHLLSG